MEKKSEPETLTPVSGNIAVHEDGDHQCVVPFMPVREGQDTRGMHLFARRGDGSFERVTGEGSIHGPAQVATPEYRESWDRTFGKVNSTGGAA